MRALFFTAIATACSFGCKEQNPDYCPAHPEDPRCGASADGGIEDAPDADMNGTIDATVCLGKGNFNVCFNQPTAPRSLGDMVTFDTTTDSSCLPSQPAGWEASGQPPACFIIGTTVNVPNVSVIGSRPLVLVALNNLTVTGMLDVAAHSTPAVKGGPGAPATACVATAEAGDYDAGNNKEAGGGGAGGSFFGLPGRNGGAGDVNTAAGGVAASALTTAPVLLRPGCNGQNSGDGSGGTGTAGVGGGGGGAVFLLAGGTLTITATGGINASGAGGRAGGARSGGGGGGSGGMIVLHANAFTATTGARLIANGGGGAAGANQGGGTAGNDPGTTIPLVQAATVTGCGQGCGAGGAGAAQGAGAQLGGDGNDQLGGGGGGGGLGYIRTNQAIANLAASPTPDVIQ